jgi:hypothetical protein
VVVTREVLSAQPSGVSWVFPNFVPARAAKARKREERIKREKFERTRALNPFAIPHGCDYRLEWIFVGEDAE